MKILKFYKEDDGRWYVDLPEWQGEKADLEMVAGADKTLDYISDNDNSIKLLFSEEFFDYSNELKFQELATEYGNGAFYYLENYNGVNVDMNMWLCDVTKFVFGGFPENIYFRKLTENEMNASILISENLENECYV